MLITLTGEHARQSLYQRLQDAGGLAASIAPDAFDLVICFGEGPLRGDVLDLNAGQNWSISICHSDFKAHVQRILGRTLVPVFQDPWAHLTDISEHPGRYRNAGQWFVHGGRPYRLPGADDDFPIDTWFRGAVSWLNIVYLLERGPMPTGVPAEQLHVSQEISSDLAKDLEWRLRAVFHPQNHHQIQNRFLSYTGGALVKNPVFQG